MKHIIILTLFIFALTGCGTNENNNIPDEINLSDTSKAEQNIDEEKNTDNNISENKNSQSEDELANENSGNNIIDENKLDPLDEYHDPIEEIVNSMTLQEKIGQMFMCAFRKDENGGITSLNNYSESIIKNYCIGGVVLFGENIDTSEQTKSYIDSMQEISKFPLFIAIDEEGGRVVRTSGLDVPIIPSAADIGKTGDTKKAYEYASQIGEYIKELGFNTNFAPVADIYTNSKNTVIGDRAFGTEPEIVSNMVSEFIKGLNDRDIYSTVKHFPGHGDTYTDSHYETAIIDFDIERLINNELKPFKAGIDADVDFVMAGHISAPNITGNYEPIIFSKYMLEDILRGQLGFDKVIITDALDMGAVTNHYSPGEAAIKAVSAGVDLLVMPSDFEAAYNELLNAVSDGTISIERIDESVKRIISLKKENIY